MTRTVARLAGAETGISKRQIEVSVLRAVFVLPVPFGAPRPRKILQLRRGGLRAYRLTYPRCLQLSPEASSDSEFFGLDFHKVRTRAVRANSNRSRAVQNRP